MPYIQISDPNLKLLIDTGCNVSMLRPIVAELYFSDFIYKSPSLLQSIGQAREATFKAKIPAFRELQTNQEIDFTLYPFSDYFDGIIGLDELRKLKLQMDFDNQILYNENIRIPFLYRDKDTQTHITVELPPFQSIDRLFYVTQHSGDIIIPQQKLFNLDIPETLTTADNFRARFEIQNKTDKTQCVTIKTPFKAIPYENEHFETYNIESAIPNYQNPVPQSKPADNLSTLIRTEHMNDEEKTAVLKLINQFPDIFHHNEEKLSFTNKIRHEIKTTDEIPVHVKSYRFPHCHKEEVRNQVNKMLSDGIIRPSQSPWSSPIWVVPKKADASGKRKWRIVVDYRRINDKTVDDRYPIPNIDDILDKLGKCNYFTTLDLASGFHQIEMSEESIPKTAFNVENGHFEYVRMPFGLKNAPATFQRVMDYVLRDVQNKICLVYMDDIIIFSTSLQEHIANLRQVFLKLRDSKLKIQLDKSEFLRQNVEFLGHVITPQGIKPNPNKIRAIQNFPIPKTAREIKSFLGLLGFYRKFIKDFSKITKPFTKCLKKNEKIIHNQEFLKAFNLCKNILTNEPLLQFPDFSKPFLLTTDASNFAIGAVLSQGPIGQDKPIAFASRTLNAAEINYSTIEKELLSIVNFTKYFRPYLFGRKFTIITDHKPLEWINNLKEPNSRLMRWRLKLLEYDYNIVYKKGKENKVADALSRIEIHPIDNENQSVLGNIDQTDDNKIQTDFPELTLDDLVILDRTSDIEISPRDLVNQSTNQSTLEKTSEERKNIIVHSNTQICPPRIPNSSETVHSAQENPIFEVPISEEPINKFQNQIIIAVSTDTMRTHVRTSKPFDTRTRLEVTLPYRNKERFEEEVVEFFKNYVKPRIAYGLLIEEQYIQDIIVILQKHFQHASYRLVQTNDYVLDEKNKDKQTSYIKYHHENKTVHRGISETIKALRQNYFWPHLNEDVRDYINVCEVCQKSKYERRPTHLKFQPTPIGHKPFEHLYIDTLQINRVKFLTIIDSFSRYGQAYEITLTANHICDQLLKYMTHFGIPHKITCDQGSEFKNNLLEEFCKVHNIGLHYITKKNPNSNSPVERFHSTILEEMRILKDQLKKDDPLDKIMNYAILGYNNTIHSTTGFTPFQIIKSNLDTRTPLELTDRLIVNQYLQKHKENAHVINELVKTKNEQAKDLTKTNETRTEPTPIPPEEKVYIKLIPRKKLDPRYKQLTVEHDISEKIETNKGTYHKHRLKPQRKTTKANPSVSDDTNITNVDDLPGEPCVRPNKAERT